MERRAFVYRVAAATAAATQVRAMAPSDEVRLGFIGIGIRGTQLMSAFRVAPGAKFIAAADLYDGCLTRAGETDPGIATTKDYRAVLDRKDVDAVVIATPDHHHHRMALDALAAGKHVYLEKPMAWSIAQCRDLLAASQKHPNLRFQTGSGAGYAALTEAGRDLVKAGAIGKVSQIRMENHRNSPQGAWVYPVPPDASPQTIDWARFLGNSPKKAFDPKIFFRWRCWWEYSGGVATDLFVHHLTLLHSLMSVDAPKSVVAQGGLFRWDDGRTVPDLMQAVYEYPGFLASLHVNLGNGRGTGQTVVVHGTEGTLVFEGRGKLIHYPEVAEDDVQPYGTLQWPKALRARYFEEKGWTADGQRKTPWPEPKPAKEITIGRKASAQEAFIQAIRVGTPVAESAANGCAAASAAHLANLSFKKGRRISLT
jgi:predicted dehydrogenase